VKEIIIRLLSIINIEKSERRSIFYLLFQAFFIGGFNSLLYIIAHSLFLKSEGADRLPEAFIMSGIIALFMVILYHIFINSLKFKIAKKIFSIFIALLITSLLMVNFYLDITNYHYFLFCSVFPIQILSLQKFNSTLNHFFPGKQSIRFFAPLHNTREFGFIAIGYILPLLIFFEVELMYLIYLGVAFYILHVIFEFLFLKTSKKIEIEDEKKSFKMFQILGNRFTRQMTTFILLSSLIGFLIHYAFILITKDNFQSSLGLIKFFGVFMATMVMFSFFANKYLLNRILNNLGLPYSIVLSPIFIGLFIIIASLVGLKSESTTTLSGYTFVFLFFAAGKFI